MVARGRSMKRDYGDRKKSKSKFKAKNKKKCWSCNKSWHVRKDYILKRGGENKLARAQ